MSSSATDLPTKSDIKNPNNTNKKILVAGDVLGRFSKFYKRLKVVNEKAGPFHFVLCVGSFFSVGDENNEDPNLVYIAKEFKDEVPLQIYCLGPVCEYQRKYYKPLFDQNLRGVPSFEEGFELARNVTYLGKKGVLTTVDDLKIAYLSGLEGEQSTDYTFDLSTVDELISACSSTRIDILLTTNFPCNVNEHSYGGKGEYLKILNDCGSLLVSKLARYCLPRYHFSSSEEQFFEREPYRNHVLMQEQPKLVTRFISIAGVDNEKKEKWLYAFNIVPSASLTKEEINKQPDDSTENPYASIDFDQIVSTIRPKIKNDNSSYFFETKEESHRRRNNYQFHRNRGYDQFNHSNQYNSAGKRSNPSHQDDGDKRFKSNDNSCWFCLSSPEVEKSLIISIGDHAYLALAKGGLNENHLLILPIGHYKSLTEIENNPSLTDVYEEIGKFKNAIIDYFQTKDRTAIFFERNFKSGHLQLQAIAIPRNKVDDLRDVLQRESKLRNFRLYEIPNNSKFSDQIGDKTSYFYMEFPGERYFIGINIKLGFPIQFGREILTSERVLNCPAKVNWRNCELAPETSKNLADKIRKEFRAFDFTL